MHLRTWMKVSKSTYFAEFIFADLLFSHIFIAYMQFCHEYQDSVRFLRKTKIQFLWNLFTIFFLNLVFKKQ